MRTLWLAMAVAAAAWPQAAPAPAKPATERQAKPSPGAPKPAAPAAVPSYKDLKYAPLKPVQIPKIETVTLPNGLRLYLLEDRELPVVSGTALVRAGNLFDPPDKIGLATVTGEVMRSGGTKAKSGDELDVQLENIAASVESDIGESSGTVSFSALKENTAEVLGVFRDVLTAPEFRQDKIDLVKTQLASSIARRNDDPNGIVGREFPSIVYGRNTPYGWSMEYEHLNRITRDDLIAFHKRYFFPANVMLAVRGDFSAAEMRAQLEQLFGSWDAKQPPVPPFPELNRKPAPGIFLADKSDLRDQTFFSVGHLGGQLNDKDFPALAVMGDILAGGFRSRLFQRIRSQLGFGYSISGGWGASYNHPGLFQVNGNVGSTNTSNTLRIVREEIEKMRAEPPSAAEVETAKQTVLNSFVFFFDTKAKTLSRLLTYEYFGYPKDFIYQYQKAVAAVTPADVQRVAKQHLNPESLTYVTVASSNEVKDQLAALNLPVTPIDLTIKQPKAETAAADSASLARGKQILARAQQAAGGLEKLAAVKDWTRNAAGTLASQGGEMKLTAVTHWVAPSHFRQESQLPFGKITVYWDGKSGWIAAPQGSGPLPPPYAKQIQGELFRDYFALLLSDRDPSRTVNAITGDTVEITVKGGDPVRVSFGADGLIATVAYPSVALDGPAQPVVETWSDFRDVNGIKVPFRESVTQGGKPFSEVRFTEWKWNTGVKPEDLARKP